MPRMISLCKASEETGVSYGCLRRLCNQGKLIHIRSGKKILLNSEYYNSGKVTIKINDTYCPWNNDCFTLEFGNNTIVTRGGIPDIEMDIKSFTSSILGRYDFDSCKIFPDIKVYGNEENLKKVFFPKSCFIEEHF